jgi:DNA-binding CsgD family transcriptional regulator
MLASRESRTRLLLAAIGLAAFILMLGVEVATEDGRIRPLDLLGDALQTALLVATAVACALLATRMQSQHEEKLNLIRDLEAARAEGEAWRREAHVHVEGLGAAIDRQFEIWGLTEAEREIGILMLKGLSHKEIASLRGTGDPTVRHQATTIYQKAGVESRTAFCAFFLEDLLPGDGGGANAASRPASSPVAGASSPDRFQTPPRR